ncbi:MAG: divalent-cation tolerance protein CutA [Sphingopyxis sp.]|uniref:divalent-cation tolerance protein CutA n=1 Tax=Sphingopyxis sp. TaxID=1908224 RepID=UPI002AB81068|nr:divalent-cation tolerance protein CutA [Sphingopyxis sp.]MDZ3831742.1 divalent-cation tolerance protein CutA [Sphingopyxis sp.]
MTRVRCVVVTTTVGTGQEADAIAEALVAERLAACVQAWPVASRYRWQGQVTRSEEFRIEAKTSPAQAGELIERIAALHPYDLPEIIAAEVETSAAYAGWVESETDAE